jgi:hypothetical protein
MPLRHGSDELGHAIFPCPRNGTGCDIRPESTAEHE